MLSDFRIKNFRIKRISKSRIEIQNSTFNIQNSTFKIQHSKLKQVDNVDGSFGGTHIVMRAVIADF